MNFVVDQRNPTRTHIGSAPSCWPPRPTHTLTTFIGDVAPQVRERVAERRASSPLAATPSEQGA